MKKINKFGIITVSLLSILGILTGCGSENDESGNGENTTLRFAWWGSQARHDATIEVIEMYEEENPDVQIEYEYYDFAGYKTKLNTLVAADNVWDVFQIQSEFPAYLNTIEPLDEYVSSGVIDVSDATESYLATTKWEDKQIGLSLGVNAYAIAYNPEMFEQAGIKEPNSNWTWEDFKEIALEIHEKTGKFGVSSLVDFQSGALTYIPQTKENDNFYNENLTGLGFDDYSVLNNYVQMRKELVDAKAYPDTGKLSEILDIESDFLVTGESAMTMCFSNQFENISDISGKKLKMINLPRVTADGPSGMALNSAQMLSMSTSSKNKKEAAKFINFFLNDEEANDILNGERGVSIMSKIRDKHKTNASESGKQMFDYIDEIGNLVSPEIEKGIFVNSLRATENQAIQDQYILMLEKALIGEKKVDEAMKEFYDFSAEKVTK